MYTMRRLGKGWIIPLATEIGSFDDLKKEVIEMGNAEGFEDGISSPVVGSSVIRNRNVLGVVCGFGFKLSGPVDFR